MAYVARTHLAASAILPSSDQNQGMDNEAQLRSDFGVAHTNDNGGHKKIDLNIFGAVYSAGASPEYAAGWGSGRVKYPASSSPHLTSTIPVPHGWTAGPSTRVRVLWTASPLTSGSVVWEVWGTPVVAGCPVTLATACYSVVSAGGSKISEASIAYTFPTLAASNAISFILRRPSSGSDTLAGSAHLLAAWIEMI